MKAFFVFCLLCQLAIIPDVQAQIVIQGDSVYQGLQSGKSTQSDVLQVLGKPNSIKESLSFVHILYRGRRNRDGHAMRLSGYSLNYRKLHMQLILDQEKISLTEIRCGPKAKVVTTTVIQPTKSTFADVVRSYAAIDQAPAPRGMPVNVKATKHYTYLRYQEITFVSYGRWRTLEELLTKRVDEIWL